MVNISLSSHDYYYDCIKLLYNNNYIHTRGSSTIQIKFINFHLPSTLRTHPCDPHHVPALPSVCSGSYRCRAGHDWKTDTPPTPCSRTVGGAHPLCPDIPKTHECPQ